MSLSILEAVKAVLHAPSSTKHNATAWRVFYLNGSGVMTELALGASGTFLVSNGASSAPSFGTASVPGSGYHVVETVWAGFDTEVGGWTRAQASTVLTAGYVYRDPSAINNSITYFSKYLNDGTYTLAYNGYTSSTQGIVSWQFDGVTQGTIDNYTAGAAQDVYRAITGLAVTAGVKVPKFLMATKNASASDYSCYVMGNIAYVRTGA